MNRFVKIFVRASSLLLILTALRPAIFASVDDAQSFALQAAEPYVKQGFQVREDYWGGDLGSGEKKACDSSCSKETSTGFGWERKSIRQRYPFMFTIPMASLRKNRIAGRKAILRLHT
jgi:hypothetical protein